MLQSRVVTSSGDAVTLISTASGGQEWQYGPIQASSRCVVVKGTTVGSTHVYVGDYDGWIHKLAFATGALLGKIQAGGPVRGLTHAKGVLYATAGNSLQAHHLVDGELWTQPMGDLAWGDPVWSNGIVFAGSWDDKLYAIKSDGTPAWISTAFSYFAAEPAVAGGLVYASGHGADGESYLVALDAGSGDVQWQAQAPNKATILDPVTIGDGRVYAPTGWGGLLCAFDAATGAAQWSVGTQTHSATPLFHEGRIYLASENGGASGGRLRAFDSDTGAVLWTSQALIGSAGDSVSRPTVDEGDVTNYVLVTSQDGYLHAFDRDTGELEWKAAIGDGFPNDPTWTDAAGPLTRPGRLREYRTIDPLALILPGPVYAKINLPNPPPVEEIVARFRKSAGPTRRGEMQGTLSELRRIGSYIESLTKGIQGELRAGPGGIRQ